MTPQGQRFNQKIAEELSKEEELVFLCGHYEALMSGLWRPSVQSTFLLGICPYRRGASCMVMIDCISRLVPGCWGTEILQNRVLL